VRIQNKCKKGRRKRRRTVSKSEGKGRMREEEGMN
jgi:hypothetical protein